METWFLIVVLYFGEGPQLGTVSSMPIQSKYGQAEQICRMTEAKMMASVKQITWSQCVRASNGKVAER